MKTGKNKNGVIYWTDYINGKRVKRENKKWQSYKDAKAHYKEYINQLADKENEIEIITIEKAIELYIDFAILSLKPSTVRTRKNRLNSMVKPHFKNGKQDIKSISAKDVQKWQKEISVNYKKHDGTSIKNGYLELVQSDVKIMFNYLVKFGYLDQNPFNLFPTVKRHEYELKKELTILTYEEFSGFYQSLENIVHKTLFSLLYWCGLRVGELYALRIQSYDRKEKTLNIVENYDYVNKIYTTTKTGESRIVDVPDVCAEQIESLILEYEKSTNKPLNLKSPLFAYDGVIPHYKMSEIKNKLIDEYNESNPTNALTRFTFHDLRHTHVSTLIDLGWNTFQISKRLGHSVTMVNETYGHLFPKKRESLLNSLNKLSEN